MVKYLQGKVLDTDTAEFIGEWNNCANSPEYFYKECLYRNHFGTYFIYSNGGILSPTGNTENIRVISFDTALLWAKNKLNNDIYTQFFLSGKEDNRKVCIATNIDKLTAKRLRRICDEQERKLSDVLLEAIDEYYSYKINN